MAWVKLDDQMTNHAKIEAIGVVGLGLHVAGLCYANQQLTDGFISDVRVPLLIAMEDVDRRWDDAKSLDHPAIVWAGRLVEAGVWERVDGGYQIHDYLKYQPSRREVLKERAKRHDIKAAAGKQGGKQTSSRRVAAVQQGGEQTSSGSPPTAGVSATGESLEQFGRSKTIISAEAAPDSEQSGKQTSSPVARSPYLLETPPPPRVRAREKAEDWYEYVTGRLIGKDQALRQQLDDIDFVHGADCVGWAFDQAIGKNDPWPYAKRILDSCLGLKNEGHGPREKVRHGRADDGGAGAGGRAVAARGTGGRGAESGTARGRRPGDDW